MLCRCPRSRFQPGWKVLGDRTRSNRKQKHTLLGPLTSYSYFHHLNEGAAILINVLPGGVASAGIAAVLAELLPPLHDCISWWRSLGKTADELRKTLRVKAGTDAAVILEGGEDIGQTVQKLITGLSDAADGIVDNGSDMDTGGGILPRIFTAIL